MLQDSLTRVGVRLWQPSQRAWAEVSCLGQLCSLPRPSPLQAGAPLDPAAGWSNELQHGSIIDVGGVCLVFFRPSPSPAAAAAGTGTGTGAGTGAGTGSGTGAGTGADACADAEAEAVVASFNDQHPVCPIMMGPIDFSFVAARERALNAYRRLEREGGSYHKSRPFAIPLTDLSHVAADRRSYVFPACGHIFGCHRELRGRSCPLCRQAGPFTPVAFCCDSPAALRGPDPPTHCFNPCGHVASRAVCEKWAAIPLPAPGASPLAPLSPRCCFCYAALVTDPRLGGPFSRLHFQREEDSAGGQPQPQAQAQAQPQAQAQVQPQPQAQPQAQPEHSCSSSSEGEPSLGSARRLPSPQRQQQQQQQQQLAQPSLSHTHASLSLSQGQEGGRRFPKLLPRLPRT